MSLTPRILAFAGSARRESLNRKLLAAVAAAVRAAGGEVTLLDLNDYPLPLYHGDLEDKDGMPANAQRLVALVTQHPALLIASPEYNSLITPLLKNTIDWCTRADPNPFAGKVAAVVSASPGGFGGVRSAQLTRQLLLHLGCHVVPAQCTLPRADQAFAPDGGLRDAHAATAAQRVAEALVHTTRRLLG
jgi:chromate reductase, NAD(P)H dehydrogenase (quinone)